jgi:hypothetical protein
MQSRAVEINVGCFYENSTKRTAVILTAVRLPRFDTVSQTVNFSGLPLRTATAACTGEIF